MRYFKVILNTNAEKIEANSKVRLGAYAYESPIAAVNGFMYKIMRNGVTFIAYESGYGDEAINTTVQVMENHRDNVIVIFAGYPTQMKQFLDRNPVVRKMLEEAEMNLAERVLQLREKELTTAVLNTIEESDIQEMIS